MASHKENHFPFVFDVEFYKACMVMKAKVDEMYKEWKFKKEGFLKEVKNENLVRYPHSSYSLPCSLGDSHKQSQNGGLI